MTKTKQWRISNWILISSLILLCGRSGGEVIPPALAEAPESMVDHVHDPQNDKIACGNILEELDLLLELSNDNGGAIAEFVQSVADRMSDWMRVFRRLQGKTVSFERRYFEAVGDTRDVSNDVADLIYENSDQLEARILKIRESLEVCL